jgi:nitrate/nitrite transport system permease protein
LDPQQGESAMAIADSTSAAPAPRALKERLAPSRERIDRTLKPLGLGWIVPLARLAIGDRPAQQAKEIWQGIGIPLFAIACFLVLWESLAPRVVTSLGAIPGPVQVLDQAELLWADHVAERAKERAYYERQEQRIAEALAKDPNAEVKRRTYTGRPTYLDQIATSLKTVFTGFLFASLIAIPLGVLCGLSATFNAALNPIVQIFKPVSPLAWLPIVTMIVSAMYVEEQAGMPKSFLTSAITVTLCSLWPPSTATSSTSAAFSSSPGAPRSSRSCSRRRCPTSSRGSGYRSAWAGWCSSPPRCWRRTPASESSSGTSSRTALQIRSPASWSRC